VAFALANAITYVEEVRRTGMAVDEFAPRLAFYFVCQADFFEEVAKFRAARRAWAKIMRDRFGARNPESMRMRFHCQTAAATLTRPQYRGGSGTAPGWPGSWRSWRARPGTSRRTSCR
jgi:methylmalonyl-CoA mutase N-terminal domain/subunit